MLQNFGGATVSTLKADEWWTLGTIYLPMALISLWGEGTPHLSDYEASWMLEVLEHIMSLVSTVIMLSKHSVSKSHADQMTHYLSDLQIVHPNANFHLYHYLSLHMPYFFDLFGLSHCFWTFPFEIFIGWIQCPLSNHKIGTSIWLWLWLSCVVNDAF